jgi:FixJ family two-component response regulator
VVKCGVDQRAGTIDEGKVLGACERLFDKLNPKERAAFDLWVEGRTLKESATALKCSEAKVSYMRKRIRDLLLSE